jgi:CheY-like chemotaxis protein
VVEDDRDIREAIQDALGDAGYETAAASDGREALEYLRSHPAPRLILLDWNMAPMNGAEVMVEVAKEPSLADIPIVLLTADARVVESVQVGGFVGCLKKPVDLDALFGIVSRYCGG